MTNSVEGGANLFGCADYLGQKEKILGCGVEVYETLCGHSLHTKAVLVGDRLSVIGSFNMDMRSAYLDTELMLVIDSPEINAQLRGVIADYQASSRLVRPGRGRRRRERPTSTSRSQRESARSTACCAISSARSGICCDSFICMIKEHLLRQVLFLLM